MALTFNLPSQIVVQTAAQWAVDATVYSNKRILVTSDEYYGSTDQRKFKIADGTQTWANLDFMPISQTLAQVLANGSSTNAVSFKSPDSLTELLVANNNIDAYVDDTSNVSEINITPNTIVISTTGASIDLSAASVTKNSSEILTSANITQVITNGVTDKAPSEDAVYDALALKLDANNAAVTNARNRKYFAYDNTTYTYTGATGNVILKTILIPGGTMGTNSTLELFANFMKSGTAGNPVYLVYIGTSASALSGGNVVQYIQPGATSLQGGIWVRLSTKNSQTSTNTMGVSQVALIPQISQTIPINNRAFNWASDLYVHIYATGANAADTQGIQDYQMYIDNP